jgi:hypothetical protein
MPDFDRFVRKFELFDEARVVPYSKAFTDCSGGAQGGSGVRRRGLRHGGGRCRTVKEGERKGTERGVGKAAGDERVFIPGGLVRKVTGPLDRMA